MKRMLSSVAFWHLAAPFRRVLLSSTLFVTLVINLICAYNVVQYQSAEIAIASAKQVPYKTSAALTNAHPSVPVSSSTPTTKPRVAAAPLPSCEHLTAGLPSTITLTSSDTGIIQHVEQPTYYSIHGRNTAEVRTQMAQCAPTHEDGSWYSATTSYMINWRFSYLQQADGLCHISQSAVGLHVRILLPKFSTSNAPSSLTQKWQSFSSSLYTHEQGHAALDSDYARRVLHTLQTMPAGTCSTYQTYVNNQLNTLTQALQQANAQYDAVTNHGATQGAIF